MPLLDVSEAYSDIATTVFSSVIAAKAWLATVVIVLALVQVLTAARMWGRLAFLPARGHIVAGIHRWSGRIAILVSLPVFFQCVTVLGFQTPDLRVAVHAIAGTVLYGVFVAKILDPPRSQPARLGAAGRGRTGRVDSRRDLAHIGSLVLHERAVRLLMRGLWRPLRGRLRHRRAPCSFSPRPRSSRRLPPQLQPFRTGTCSTARPSSRRPAPDVTGWAARRWPGPRLVGSGLTAAEVSERVERGGGVMPADLVNGQDQADVVAYVVSISGSG